MSSDDAPTLDRARRHRILGGLAAALALALMVVVGETRAQTTGEAHPVQSQMLRQLYLNGVARITRGDAAGAVAPFLVTSQIAPELAQTHYSLAVAQMMADFAQRERSLPAIDRALALDPGNPLYAIVKVLADPALSTLAADGALYLGPTGAARIDDAAKRFVDDKAATDGRRLAPLLARREKTTDESHPQRLVGFAVMIAPNGQTLGRLLAVTVPEGLFTVYEPRMVARLRPNPLSSAVNAVDRARQDAAVPR
jgi:hypothetical protein